MLALYIRDDKPRARGLQIHEPHFGFVKHGAPASYRDAVRLGFAAAGYGNFYVHLGETKAPSREDQLLLERRDRRRRKLSAKLTEALLLD